MTHFTDHPDQGAGTPDAKRASESKRRAKKRIADIIHVAFGPGGGRITPPPPAPPPGSAAAATADAARMPGTARASEPVSDVFTPREVQKLLGLTPSRLRALARAGIVSPSGARGARRAYTFQDLIALRATHDLLEKRIRLKDVAAAIGVLRDSLPRVTRPLEQLRIVSDGRRVVVRTDEGHFEPITGQMVLDFQTGALRDDVVRLLRPQSLKARARTAYDLYARASALDEEATTFDEAEDLYRRAIDLDPDLAIAYTNLGNIRFRRGDEPGAEALYRRALEIDERQPEAHYNLGYVMLERGRATEAVHYFERALESDPRFADAHFNLAMAYETLGDRGGARPHWRRYIELEPSGTWADIARQHLLGRP